MSWVIELIETVDSLLGVLIGFSLGYFVEEKKKQSEIESQEYRHLARVGRFLIKKPSKGEISKYIEDIFEDPTFAKIASRNLIVKTLKRMEDGEDISSEKEKIESRLKELFK
jgi:hypothetical protein